MFDILYIVLQSTPLGPAEAVGDFSFLSLFLRADWIVKSVMLILILASIWSWAIAVDKFITFVTLKRRATDFEETFWSGRTLDELSQGLAKDARDPMARVFAAAMREWDASKSGARSEMALASTHERIDRVMNLVVNRELSKAERGMSVLATIGSASVFIGLFGTVWGIMNAFRAIAATQNTNLSVVAPGIAEALFATALGLIAAIPAVIFYNWFSNDLDKYAARLEGYADELSAILSRKLGKGS
jgi:biopolymer transport protein TolQ